MAPDTDRSELAAVPPQITDDERSRIQQLRAAVVGELTPYYDTDFNLLRWLKGHNYNMDEILPKLRNHLILRRSPNFDLDDAADRPRDHPVHRHWKSGLTTVAGDQNPNSLINVEQTGTNDFWGLLHAYPLNEIMRARMHDLETMLRAVMRHELRTGRQASILYILDLTGLKYHTNLVTLVRGPLAAISAFMSEHYVDLIHSFVLVGVPSFIHAIWAIAKPLLPERTKNKVKIFSGDWRHEILKLASPDALPTFWNVPNSEPMFYAVLEESVPVDSSEYYKDSGVLNDAKTLAVGAGKFAFIIVDAKKGQQLSWTFTTNGHFAYSLYVAADRNESSTQRMTPVYPRFTKVPGPTLVPIADSIVCSTTGAYKFWFSNEHAWLHMLTVRYTLNVE